MDQNLNMLSYYNSAKDLFIPVNEYEGLDGFELNLGVPYFFLVR